MPNFCIPWYSLLNKYSYCWVVFILSSAVFLHLSSVQWICIVFCWFLFILAGAEFLHLSSVQWICIVCRISASHWYSVLNNNSFWFWFILPNAEFLHLSSVQWIWVFCLATEQDAEFLHPIGIHYLLSVVFTYFYSFYQMQNFCISTQCSVLFSHWTRCRISASHL